MPCVVGAAGRDKERPVLGGCEVRAEDQAVRRHQCERAEKGEESMKEEDRLSARMRPEKVNEVYAILKERFENTRRKLLKNEEQKQSVLPTEEKR